MAEGIRIHHPNRDLWGATVLVPHPGDPTTGRKPKDYHLRLDNEGNVIVSQTVWNRLQEARKYGLEHGFIVTNIVKDPPPINLNFGIAEQNRTVRLEADALRDIAPAGFKPRIVDGAPRVS